MFINITKINLNPNSGGKPIELESKEITITENGTTTVTPSDGFGGMSNVNITTDVPTPRVEANKSISITENGAYTVTPSTGYVGVGDVDISVFVSEVGTSIDFSEIGYNATDNANANMIIQDGINYAKQIQTEYTDSKTYKDDMKLVYFPNIDTSNRTSCSSLFTNTPLLYLPPLTISNKCTNLNNMFQGCGVKNIDTTNWDTSNVTEMNYTFAECPFLEEIKGIENWDTSKCNNMQRTFQNNKSIKSLDLSNWDTSKVKYMGSMFEKCKSLESLNLSNWKFTNLNNNSYDNIIYDCSNLKYLNISGWDFTGRTSYPTSFLNNTGKLETIDVSNINFGTMKKCFDLSPYPNGYYIKNIIGLETWNTSGFNDMSNLFEDSRNVTSLNLSNWNTSNVTKMTYMFNTCTKLTEIIGIENLDTSNVTNMNTMFGGCSSLTTLNLSSWNVQNVTSMGYIFNQCTNLTDLNLSGWDVSNIPSLYLSFGYMNGLTNFQAPQNINTEISVSWSINLTVDSLLSILNNLTDRTGTTSITCRLGSTNLAKLTDEQKAIATSKNWVLA